MKTLTLLAIGLAISTAAGCWSWSFDREVRAKQLDQDAPLELCLNDHGVDPLELKSCVMNSQTETAGRECLDRVAGTPDKIKAAHHCILAEQNSNFLGPISNFESFQLSAHTSNCSSFTTGVRCQPMTGADNDP